MSESLPNNPERLKAFAAFFKNYMSVWAIIVAALPLPVTAFKLIPVYSAQSGMLSTFTTLFCFLLLGFIFYSRHAIARAMFRDVLGTEGFLTRSMSVAPAVLICLSLVSAGLYYYFLTISIQAAMKLEVGNTDFLLINMPLALIPFGVELMLVYLFCFLFAEAAFILMAIREYLQEVLGLTDVELVKNQRPQQGP